MTGIRSYASASKQFNSIQSIGYAAWCAKLPEGLQIVKQSWSGSRNTREATLDCDRKDFPVVVGFKRHENRMWSARCAALAPKPKLIETKFETEFAYTIDPE